MNIMKLEQIRVTMYQAMLDYMIERDYIEELGVNEEDTNSFLHTGWYKLTDSEPDEDNYMYKFEGSNDLEVYRNFKDLMDYENDL